MIKTKKLSMKTSDEIKMLYFLMTIMVLYIHARRYFPWDARSPETMFVFLRFIEMIFSEGICRLAVPFFFLFSGFFLFFNKVHTFSYFDSVRKRFFSLVLPYLMWNLLNFFLFAALDKTGFASLSSRVSVSSLTIYHVISTIASGDYCGQLWYLRTLFVFVLLSFFLDFIYIKIPKSIIFFLGICWFFQVHSFFDIHNYGGLFFFSVGSVIAKRFDLRQIKISRCITYLFPFLIFMRAVLSIVYNDSFALIGNLATVAGILFFWKYRSVFFNLFRFIFKFASASFFIYAFHQPAMSFFFKILMTQLPNCEPVRILIYIFLPLFVLLIALSFAYILNRFFPFFLRLLTGNRNIQFV